MSDTDQLQIERPWVTDERTVRMAVTGAPDICTPLGARPIKPSHVRITYDMARQAVTSVVVTGRGKPNPRNYRERDGLVRRRVSPDGAPFWLAKLIEEYRP